MSMSGYFGTRRYLNPPSAPPHRPQFSQPPQLGRTPYWDRYVTVMPTLFKCKQSRAPAHTIRIWHIICSPIPVFFCNPCVYLNAGLRSRISVCMILIFAQLFLWFSVTCWLRFHRTPPPSFVIGQQLFPASSSGKLARTACQTSSKNSVGKIENKFTPSLVGDAGVTTKANDGIMEARKQNCDASTTVWWSILSRAKLVSFDICLDYHRLKITLKRIIWKPGSPC